MVSDDIVVGAAAVGPIGRVCGLLEPGRRRTMSTPSIWLIRSRKGSAGSDRIPGSDLKPIKYRCLRRTTVAEVFSRVPVVDSVLSSPNTRSDAANGSVASPDCVGFLDCASL